MYRYTFEKSNGRINWSVMEQFNDWINMHGLMDIDISNRRFTWSNKRRDPILAKLDRVPINAIWSQDFPQTFALAKTAPTSDHHPVLVDFNKQIPVVKLFRFENHWLHVQEVNDIITDV